MSHAEALPPRGVLDPRAAARSLRLELIRPSPELEPIVDRHWVLSWDLSGRRPHVQDVLPHPCVNIAFAPGRHGVYGIPNRRVRRTLTGSGLVVGTRLRPGALSVYCGMPAAQLTGEVASLVDVFGADGAVLERRAVAASAAIERVAAVEGFLRDRLRPLSPEALLAQRVVDAMATTPPGTAVADLACAHDVSPRTLQRLFRRYVGVPPKWVLRRRRIHEAAEQMVVDPELDLGRLALDLGYCDQAHFANDFRSVVGRSPSDYRRLQL